MIAGRRRDAYIYAQRLIRISGTEMKKTILFFYSICWLLNSSFSQGTWVQKDSFPGTSPDFAFSFTIGHKGYVGAGRYNVFSFTKEFWEYDAVLNTWTQKADFAGSARCAATGIAIGDKGYAGLGGTTSLAGTNWWQYDTTLNVWTQKA